MIFHTFFWPPVVWLLCCSCPHRVLPSRSSSFRTRRVPLRAMSAPPTAAKAAATPATSRTGVGPAAAGVKAATTKPAGAAAGASTTSAAAAAAASAYDFGPFRPGEIAAVLQSRFGHPSLRDTQAAALSSTLRGRDCFVLAPTGGGKSLCYQLPAMLQARSKPGSVTIVVSPLIALMQDQVIYLRSRGIQAAMLGSSVSAADKRLIFADLNAPTAAAAAAAAAAKARRPDPDDINARPVEDQEREERWAAYAEANGSEFYKPKPHPPPPPPTPAVPQGPRLAILFMSPVSFEAKRLFECNTRVLLKLIVKHCETDWLRSLLLLASSCVAGASVFRSWQGDSRSAVGGGSCAIHRHR